MGHGEKEILPGEISELKKHPRKRKRNTRETKRKRRKTNFPEKGNASKTNGTSGEIDFPE
jgi:hypothetical protein